MVRVPKRDDVVIAGESSRHQDREIVGLGAGIDEVTDFEIAWHFGVELARVFGHFGVQMYGRGVLECLALEVGCTYHLWLARTDGGCCGTPIDNTITAAFSCNR